MRAQSRNDSSIFIILLSICVLFIVGQSGASARGGGYVREPKEVRQAGLWYGDAFVNEEDKRSIYSNYHGSSKYYGTPNPPNAYEGQTNNYGGGNPYHQVPTPAPMYTPAPSQQFSGPAQIGPSNYHYFVQEYDWGRH